MASIVKTGTGWRVQIQRKGVRLSKMFPTKAEAKAWATQEEAKILAGSSGQTVNKSLREAFERYACEVSPSKRGARWEKLRLALFIRTMPFVDKYIKDVTPDDIGRWRDMRLLGVKRSTVRREFTLLKSVFSRAVKEWRWLQSNPMKDVTTPDGEKPRSRRIAWQEVLAICKALGYKPGRVETKSQEVAIAFLFALRSAMRSGEILSLSDSSVDFEKRIAHLYNTKNGDDRVVPLPKKAVRLLKFMSGRGNFFTVTPEARDALFRKARDKAGIRDLHFHDARAEALTRLSRKVDVLTLSRISGHRDLNILMSTYYRESAEQIAARL